MEAKLVVVGGKANKSEIELKLPTVIGRGRDADLTVAHPTVSRHHCVVFEQDGVLVVRDNGSLNGTLVDGNKVQEAMLQPGDTLTVGPLTFRADYQLVGQPPKTPSFPATSNIAETIGSLGAPGAAMDETVHFDSAVPDVPAPSSADADSDSEFDFFPDEPEETKASAGPANFDADTDVLGFLNETPRQPQAPSPVPDPSDATIDLDSSSSYASDEFSLAPIDEKPAEPANRPAKEGDRPAKVEDRPAKKENKSQPAAAKNAPAKTPAAKDDELDDFFNSIGVK
jgi:predicted component of type VI protein secretion system